MEFVLVPHDPTWSETFTRVAADLRRHGNPDWIIEHVGSTAIPGMSAKPIIDVAVRIADDADLDLHRPGLEAAGWVIGSSVRSHRVMVFEENGVRTRIAHFFETADWDQVNQRILRDWLLQNPEDADLYERVKYAAADASRMGEESYNAGKTAVVQLLIDRARAARGLPSVSVYDKD
ncbi:dephospho-CoA kinase/protein folding accessory domain-containing protein [Microbacterium oxydans]|uniref:Dephospho-CoA kinase/protein folding accessory domain-containing protein n=1 Tax=Microbacterium oxydans TaxID=82380 RepID=A0A0F0KUF2_9MICO|nr:GrpB family protein [Microbacterium oxydans]KJL22861.1 dephospho-CoA kinase/protein folding accessory domain-containing protein [Microbacterium oxydans]